MSRRRYLTCGNVKQEVVERYWGDVFPHSRRADFSMIWSAEWADGIFYSWLLLWSLKLSKRKILSFGTILTTLRRVICQPNHFPNLSQYDYLVGKLNAIDLYFGDNFRGYSRNLGSRNEFSVLGYRDRIAGAQLYYCRLGD